MITFISSPDESCTGGHGPRLWVKFEDSDTRTEAYRLTYSALDALSIGGKYDRIWFDNNVESDGQILSWEFPPNSWNFRAAITCLDAHHAKRVDGSPHGVVEFIDGFSRDR